jgi:hypothetical protein
MAVLAPQHLLNMDFYMAMEQTPLKQPEREPTTNVC